MKIAFSNIKGISSTLSAEPPCVVFSGRGSSGKTAHMDAVRLALTGRSSVGAAVASLHEVCNGQGQAAVEGDDWVARWEMVGKSRRTFFEKLGEACDSNAIVGCSPTTVSDLLALSGEAQWSLIGQLAGVHEYEAMASGLSEQIKLSKKKVFSLGECRPPDVYGGPPLAVLESKLAELDLGIAEQARHQESARRFGRIRASLESSRTMIVSSKERIASLEMDIASSENELVMLDAKERLWLATDGKEPAAIRDARAKGETRHQAIFFALNQVYTLTSAARDLAAAGGMDATRGSLSLLCSRIQQAQGEHQEFPDFGDTLRPTLPEFADFNPDEDRRRLRKAIDGMKQSLSQEVAALARLQASAAEQESLLGESLVVAMNPADLDAKVRERNSVRDSIAAARAWMGWIEGSEARQAELAAAQSELAGLQAEDESLRRKRAQALDDATRSVSSAANRYLEGLGWEMVLKAESTARQQWLSIKNQSGIELRAMAGNEQAIFGLALICAIQDLEGAHFPVVFHECAEIEPERLKTVAESIAKHRKRGCVFLSHWASPGCDSTVTEIRV